MAARCSTLSYYLEPLCCLISIAEMGGRGGEGARGSISSGGQGRPYYEADCPSPELETLYGISFWMIWSRDWRLRIRWYPPPESIKTSAASGKEL
jgi:hypothetical protein